MFRTTKVKHYLRRMEARGYSPDEVLAGSRIDAGMLDDPNYLIDISQSQQVVSNMMSLTGNPYLGFELGREVSFDDFGIIGYALMCSRTLREVTELWASMGHPLVGTLLKLQMEEKPGCWRVNFTEVSPLGPLLRFCTEENLTLGNWICSTVIGRKLTYKSIEFSYPEPANSEIYRETFGTEIVFNAPVTATNIISPTPDEPNAKERDPEFYNVCRQYCFQVLRQISENRPVAFKVRQLLLDSAGDLPSVEEAAQALHYSVRTFKRHLQGEGVSYQQLVNEFRNDMARKYLRSNPAMPLQKIADLLGYGEAKSLSRAFAAWNGMSITEYRNSQRASLVTD